MSAKVALEQIKSAIQNAPRNAYVAELHLQVLKYSDVLEGVTGKEFCEALGIALLLEQSMQKCGKLRRAWYKQVYSWTKFEDISNVTADGRFPPAVEHTQTYRLTMFSSSSCLPDFGCGLMS